jgi:hypothetical protein
MLTLELEKENFKRFNNGKGYSITVSTEDKNRKCYNVFETLEHGNKYLPSIIVENYNEDGSYRFEISNCVHVNQTDLDEAIRELERYLSGYKVARDSIEEFKTMIEKDIQVVIWFK